MADVIGTTAEATDAAEATSEGDAGFDELQQQFDDKGVPFDKSEPAPTDAKAEAGKAIDGKEDAGTEGEEAAVAPSKTESAAVELTKIQAEAAKQLGLSDDDIAALGKGAGDILEKAGMKVRQKISELGLIQKQLNDKAVAAEKSATKASEGDGLDTEGEVIFSSDDLLDGDEGADKLNQLVKGINTLRGELADLKKTAADADDRETVATCDRFFDGLDHEDYSQFGKGSLRSLTESSDEYKARQELVAKADVLGSGYEVISGYSPSKEQLLNEALTLVAAEQTKAAARRETARKISDRSKQRIGRPGGRQAATKTVDDEAAAKQKLAQQFLDKGIKPGGSPSRKLSW